MFGTLFVTYVPGKFIVKPLKEIMKYENEHAALPSIS